MKDKKIQNTTTIQISTKIWKELHSLKSKPSEDFNDVILNLLKRRDEAANSASEN